MNIKLNSRVKAILPCDKNYSVQYEKGTVIYMGRRVLVQFDSNICGHNGNGLGKSRYCWMMDWEKIKEVSQ